VDENALDIDKMCRDYSEALRAADPQLCLLGIGENGHLAFNDPAEANFNDPSDIRTVHFDKICRQQQAAEGWFKTYEEVPELAVKLPVSALFRVPRLIISIPGKRKASIVRRTVKEPISTGCPSTILRTRPDATVFLDEESDAELTDLLRLLDCQVKGLYSASHGLFLRQRTTGKESGLASTFRSALMQAIP
jgi:glucosamine-6-phosphate deaminase